MPTDALPVAEVCVHSDRPELNDPTPASHPRRSTNSLEQPGGGAQQSLRLIVMHRCGTGDNLKFKGLSNQVRREKEARPITSFGHNPFSRMLSAMKSHA